MGLRQCISIQIGQCGIQMGNSMWELYCLEHGIEPDGTLNEKSNPILQNTNTKKHTFFHETKEGKCTPRTVLADLEPSILDELKCSNLKDLYNPMYMVSGKEDAASNFARGYYTVGKEMLKSTMATVRKIAEECDNIEGFLLFHSSGGGTGSGFRSLLMNNIVNEYQKKNRLEFTVFPAPQVSSSVVEPYNAILSVYSSLTYDHADCTFYIDNEGLYSISQKKLNMARPTYNTLNRLLAQAVSSTTASLRFDGHLNVQLSDFKMNLVPFPSLRFPVISYAPIIAPAKVNHEQLSVKNITSEAFASSNQLAKCDVTKGKFMACCLLYRGDVVPKDINDAIQGIKGRKNINFVEWCPTGIKVGINYQPPCKFRNNCEIATVQRAVCMLSNSTAIGELWGKLTRKFDVMFKERAFIHWYLREGMEQHEFVEARMNLEMLKKDYKEVETGMVLPKTLNEL